MEAKILNYLANGLAASQIATLVGCSPGYISQLLAKDDFKAKLKQLILDNPATVDDKLEDKYSALEHSLVNAMTDAIPGAELPAITRALETISKIKHERHIRKNPALASTNNLNVQVVQLTMPTHLLRHNPVIHMNENSEILAIDNEPMAPLSSDGVRNLFEAIKTKKASIALEL